MLKYLKIMSQELEQWLKDPKCTFSDQGLHNYLFYSGQLPFAASMENWVDGIINTAGYYALGVMKMHESSMLRKHKGISKAKGMLFHSESVTATATAISYSPAANLSWTLTAKELPFDGANGMRWIGEEYFLVDDDGYFTQVDGSRSRAIHQWDRFNSQVDDWLRRAGLWWDPMPTSALIDDFGPDESFSACLHVTDVNHLLVRYASKEDMVLS